jgi:hypothetical protein
MENFISVCDGHFVNNIEINAGSHSIVRILQTTGKRIKWQLAISLLLFSRNSRYSANAVGVLRYRHSRYQLDRLPAQGCTVRTDIILLFATYTDFQL